MERVLRAHTLSETRGFLKALVGVNNDLILGFTAFAVDAGEIMASVQTAMIAGPYTALRDAIWAHPTLVEGLSPLFSSAPSLPTAFGCAKRRSFFNANKACTTDTSAFNPGSLEQG
jgi:Pyridine nucleotide-disulphide oxidoreductase, dimerisation domain